jgi:hypothetical protein
MSTNNIINQFSEYNNGTNIRCTERKFREILEKQGLMKKKRTQCSFFLWLSDNRKNIQSTYFGDFNEVTDWCLYNKKEYYSNKELPLDKVVKDGRPRIVSLITTKAGIIWKGLSDEDKHVYEVRSNVLKDNAEDIMVEIKDKPRKRGRPKKETNTANVSEALVEKYKEDIDSISVEEIMYNNKKYYIDIDNHDIYDPETDEIVGKRTGTKININ